MLKEEKKANKSDEDELSKLKEQLEAAQAQSMDKETAIKDVKKELDVIRKAAGAHLKQLTGLENQLEQLKTKRHTIYRGCRRDEIKIPIESGELPQGEQ